MTLWPDVQRVCFDSGTPSHLNACVQWVLSSRETGARAYVYGYRRAAEAFFEHATHCQRMSPDYVVFPLVFLWRHHLELALKDVIALGKLLLDESESSAFPAHHRLGELWQVAKPYIVKHGSPDAPELAHVEANILEFERIDPTATGFRYPRDRTGASTALVNPPDTVNLAVLHETMLALSNFLDGVHSSQQQAFDTLSEIAAQYR